MKTPNLIPDPTDAHVWPNLRRVQDWARGSFQEVGSLHLLLGDGVAVVTLGVNQYFMVPTACTLTGWVLVGSPSGSLEIDVWRVGYDAFPPSSADSITGGDRPRLLTAQKNRATSLSSWNATLAAGDWLALNVVSAAAVTRATLELRFERTVGGVE